MKTFQEHDPFNVMTLNVSSPAPGKRLIVSLWNRESKESFYFGINPDQTGLAQASELITVLSEWMMCALRHNDIKP